MNLLITFEGTEGVGKTTQIGLLCEWLRQQHQEYIQTFEPGDTALGKSIRHMLLHAAEVPIDRAELLLYLADRAQHVEQVLRPGLANGHIICDRYIDATIAYQAYGRGMDAEWLHQLNSYATNDLVPHLTILLDAPVEEGLLRAKARAELDRMESEKLSFHQRVRDGYLTLANNNERFVLLDARQTIADIHQQIIERVHPLLQQ